jgi:hypothetical protein
VIRSKTTWVRVMAATLVLSLAAASSASAAFSKPSSDPFFRYTGPTPLAQISPGTVLRTRTIPYHVGGNPLPFRATQVLYRSTGMRGQPTVNVTSFVKPWRRGGPKRLVSYHSFYDSLDPDDGPAAAIAGHRSLGTLIPDVETLMIFSFLRDGYTVAIPDTEGLDAVFGAGPEYGMNALDGIRAVLSDPTSGLNPDTPVGLIGYSGGAIATAWGAELAPAYAPDINDQIVGAAMGGVLVAPANNLKYVQGSRVWTGVMPMALIGVARAFGVDFTPYLNEYGARLTAKLRRATIVDALGQYPGLTWADVTKPEYPEPENVEVFVRLANKLILGTYGTPTAPLFVGQGAGGQTEGTSASRPGIGPGDGVMIAGDVRTLVRQYCQRGTRVLYRQYEQLSHTGATGPWRPAAVSWLRQRFIGALAPENCASVPPGNSLAPMVARSR